MDWEPTPALWPGSITGQEGPTQENLLTPHPPVQLCTLLVWLWAPVSTAAPWRVYTALTQMHPYPLAPPRTGSPWAVGSNAAPISDQAASKTENKNMSCCNSSDLFRNGLFVLI